MSCGKLGAMQFLASAVALSILRELGPLLTAIVVIGRSGSAFAAEIGTKKVTEEVDALRTMAFDPVAFLVAPKFLAMLVMMPCLSIWADFHGDCRRMCLRRYRRQFYRHFVFSRRLETPSSRAICIRALLRVCCSAWSLRLSAAKKASQPGRAPKRLDARRRRRLSRRLRWWLIVDLVFTALFYFINPS